MRTSRRKAFGPARRSRERLLGFAAALVLLASSCASQAPPTATPGGPSQRPTQSLLGDTLAPDDTLAPGETLPPGETLAPSEIVTPGETVDPQPTVTGQPGTVTPAPVDNPPPPGSSGGNVIVPEGIHKIKHVVVIMQENRSFDSYFGTFPGANGIPMKHGVPTVCAPNPRAGTCDRPYHDRGFVDGGGFHRVPDARIDINGGRMNGFVVDSLKSRHFCPPSGDPICAPGKGVLDVMGYKTAREIPNYWAYAKHFVLQDRMFEPVPSWSLLSHLFLVSAWSAVCRSSSNPMSCRTEIDNPVRPNPDPTAPAPFAWTDITYLLNRAGVSWRYYVSKGAQPDCSNDASFCTSLPSLTAKTPNIWNPLPWFSDVRKNKQVSNVQGVNKFFRAAARGTLPSVSWIIPDSLHSEHPPTSPINQGQAYVTGLVNAIMKSPDWSSTAIFISWDEWGGFYDHVVPPKVDGVGYGLRVPGLVISPYAKQGFIDHQTLSFDAYLKFIEDDFLGGARLDPKTDGRPDSRPSVRENNPRLGDLQADFDFTQKPRKPMILKPFP